MTRKPDIERKVRQRIDELCSNMPFYLEVYNSSPFDKPDQLKLHRSTIQLLIQLGSVRSAIRNVSFVETLRKTLVAWDMDIRGASGQLLPLYKFQERLLSREETIGALEKVRIDDPSLPREETSLRLWDIIESLNLSTAKNQVVVGSKALHHLLPNLVPPMDRRYSRPFFHYWMAQFQNNPSGVFHYMWMGFADIASRTSLEQYIGAGEWATSIAKILDNAVVGYCKHHKLPELR